MVSITILRDCISVIVVLMCIVFFSPTTMAVDWQARHGMTSAQYQQTFDELVGQGYRLTWISGYGHWGVGYRDEPLYAAIWEKRSGPEWVARHGLTPAQYQQTFDELVGQGYRLTEVSVYSANRQEMYAAIWEKRDGPEWVARHGLTLEQYQQVSDELVRQGYRPTQISGYRVSNATLNYAAIWEKNDSTEWASRYDLTSPEYQQAFDELVGQGYRLTQVSGYDSVLGEALYAAIWEKRDGPEWVARHGLTSEQYQQAFDELVSQGYRLTQVNGYSVYGQPSMFYAAIWEKDSGLDSAA
jgi:hypothetical protein